MQFERVESSRLNRLGLYVFESIFAPRGVGCEQAQAYAFLRMRWKHLYAYGSANKPLHLQQTELGVGIVFMRRPSLPSTARAAKLRCTPKSDEQSPWRPPMKRVVRYGSGWRSLVQQQANLQYCCVAANGCSWLLVLTGLTGTQTSVCGQSLNGEQHHPETFATIPVPHVIKPKCPMRRSATKASSTEQRRNANGVIATYVLRLAIDKTETN